MQTINLYDYLNLSELGIELSENHDPGKEDIAFLIDVANKIPRTPEQMNDFEASQVASLCLVAYQRSVELHSKSTIWSGYKKIQLDSKFGQLIASSDEPATVKKEVSKSDEEYVRLAKEYEKSKAYVEFYSGLMGEFEKGHYWAKGKEVTNKGDYKSSGYEVHEASRPINNGGEENKKQESNVYSNLEKKHVQISPVEDFNL